MRKSMHDWRALLGGATMLVGSAAAAQSFNCASAQLPVEKIICADADLSRADSALGTQFKAAMEESADAATRATLLDAQRAWLRQRNACADAGCVARSYSERERAIAQGKRVVQGAALTAQPPRAACYAIHSAGYPPLWLMSQEVV